MARKPVATMDDPKEASGAKNFAVLCDDGSIWRWVSRKAEWVRFAKPVPGSEADEQAGDTGRS